MPRLLLNSIVKCQHEGSTPGLKRWCSLGNRGSVPVDAVPRRFKSKLYSSLFGDGINSEKVIKRCCALVGGLNLLSSGLNES